MSQSIRDRAWITAHVRMKSESRLRRLSFFLNLLIIWLSTTLTCLTVYQLTASISEDRDIVLAALSILLLSLSIFIPSLGLEKSADKFRECYLKIQRLLDNDFDEKSFISSYYNILDAYPNHPEQDYIDFVVSSKLNNKKLEISGKPILPTFSMCAMYRIRKIGNWMISAITVLSPGLLYFIL